MARSWTNVGRLWTNGDCFLAMDADLLPHWRGLSDGTYESVVTGLGPEVTSIPVGTGLAGFVATDPEVGDEGWIEVFRSGGAIALVQATPDDEAEYSQVVTAALQYSEDDDERGDRVRISSGRLALLSAALDGVGPDSPPMRSAATGSVPAVWPDLDEVGEAAGLMLEVEPIGYAVQIRWLTEITGGAFARWILAGDRSA